MKQATAIVTERGGRTSHVAIVARELGIPAIVGAVGAMGAISSGRAITISCAEGEVGHVYDGALKYDVEEIDASGLPQIHTQIIRWASVARRHRITRSSLPSWSTRGSIRSA